MGGGDRRELARSGWAAIRDLVAMAIGPVLIGTPYAVARALGNLAAQAMRRV